MSNVYIDPVTDFGFKRIFGSDTNKELLISFLNELFRGRKRIKDLFYHKNEFVGGTENMGTVILDLTCTADHGEQFIIEVLIVRESNWKQKLLYYGSKMVADQLAANPNRGPSNQINHTYVVALMDGSPLVGSNADQGFLQEIVLCDRNHGAEFDDGLTYICVELPKFIKHQDDLESDLDRWLYVLKNMTKMDKLPVYLRKPVFEKMFDSAQYSNLNKGEQKMYDESLKRKWDAEAVRLSQKQEIETARQEAMKVGREEGVISTARQHAQDMKRKGIALSLIAEITKLSLAEIETL